MTKDGLPVSMLEAAVPRFEAVERALSRAAQAVELGVVDLILDGEVEDESVKQRLEEIAGSLLSISGMSVRLLEDLSPLAGIDAADELQALEVTDTDQVSSTDPISSRNAELYSTENSLNTGGNIEQSTDTDDDAKTEEALSKPLDSILYDSILGEDHLSLPSSHPETSDKKITIIGPNEIVVNGEEIRLKGHQLAFFNVLLLRKGHLEPASTFFEYGFSFDTGKSARGVNFSSVSTKVTERINRHADSDFIQKKSGKRRKVYVGLDESIHIADLRNGQPEAHSSSETLKKTE